MHVFLPPTANGYVVIDAVATDGNVSALADRLTSLGMNNVSTFGRIVSGRFPVAKLLELEGVTELHFARSAVLTTNHRNVTNTGVPSQGDKAIRSRQSAT